VDSAEQRRKEAETLGISCFASLDEALGQSSQAGQTFDCAFVCTAPLSHAEIIDKLLDADLPVFTELNLIADGYEGLIAKAEEKNLLLFLSSTMLYRRETQEIAKRTQNMIDSGQKVRYIYHIGQYLPDWHPWENYQNFFVGSARTGGVREILGIELPWLLSAFGSVESLSAEHTTLSSLDLPYPDSSFITLRHKNGCTGFLAADVVSPKAVRHFEAFGDSLHIFWEGRPDSLSVFSPESKTLIPIDTYANAQHDSRYSDNIIENAYVDEIQNFFDVLEHRQAPFACVPAKPRWSFRQDLEAIKIMDSIERGTL
jgi:predicted dehydrogenase